MDNQLKAVADSQGQWSATADVLKKRFERTRMTVFALSTVAALAAAVSSQQPEDGTLRTPLAIVSTVCLALVAFLSARFLDSGHSQAWIRARAASEALKREAYKSAAQAAPYDDPAMRGDRLRTEVQRIELEIDDLIDERVDAGPSSVPTDAITPEDYRRQRVEGQIKFYEKKAGDFRRYAKRLRGVEFTLALVTTIITAVVGVSKGLVPGFDILALTAVLTTLAGAIVAYIEASRYDYLVASYRATARRLKDEFNSPPPNPQPSTPEWSAFVNRCETILQEENGSWIAKFAKRS